MFRFLTLLFTAAVSVAVAELSPDEAALLASNTVVAEYTETQDRPCRFMTADCPDRCDHAARVAVFRVIRNEDYQCHGKYADEKMEPNAPVFINLKKDEPGQAPEVRPLLESLQRGDTVRMTVNHYYIQSGPVHYPVRPVVRIEKLTPPAE